MEKIIRGTIHYELRLKDNTYDINYNTNQDNDIAALAIAEYIFSNTADFYGEIKDKVKGGDKKSRLEKEITTNTHNTLKRGKQAAIKLLTELLHTYDEFKEEQIKMAKLKDEKHEEIKKYFNDNNVTVENGVFNQEQVDELLKDKFKDMKKDSSPMLKEDYFKTELPVDYKDNNPSADENLTNLSENDN